MKIHLTGAVWHADISGHMKNAFEALGHEVIFFDERGSNRFERFKKIWLRFSRRPYEVDDRFRARASAEWIASVTECKPDLIILEHAVNILPAAVEKIRDLHIPIVYWVTSPPDLLQSKDVLLGVYFADHVMTIDRAWMPLIAHFTHGKIVHHLPLGGASENFFPIAESTKEFDISFVGSFSPQYPDGLLRAYFADRLPKDVRVGLFGHGTGYWAGRCFPAIKPLIRTEGHVSVEKLNEIYNKSEIVLNIHSTGHRTSISSRTLDASLAGAFQLVDWREDLDVLMPQGTFQSFKTADEMLALIGKWLPDRALRAAKAAEARAVVIAAHTWKHRAETLLRLAGVR